jgi:predicted Zn-dependent peptidase
MIRTLAALILALLATPGLAGAEAVHRARLENGLTVIVRENPVAPVVAVALLLRMGGRWEAAGEAGVSNFVHAVMVKGTTKRTGSELADAIAGIGGKITAAGNADYSGIQGEALARFWRGLLALTAELALEPRLSPSEVDTERDWLLSRIQRQRDNPVTRAFDTFYATLYDGHPYGRPILGTPETLKRIDHTAIVRYYRAFYRPERMVLAVSGQVQTGEVLGEARRLFGRLAGDGPVAPPVNPPPSAAAHRVVLEQPAQQAQILVGALAPPLDHPDHAAVKVLATVLGGGMAGRLFARLRDQEALAYTATAYYDPLKEPGALVLYLGTDPANAERAEAALLREVDRIRTQPIGEDELTRAKGFVLGNYAMDRRTNARLAWYLAFYTIEDVGDDYPERYARAVEAVSVADVQRVARRYLEPLTTVVLRPPR